MKNLFLSLCGFYLLCIIVMVSAARTKSNNAKKAASAIPALAHAEVLKKPAGTGVLLPGDNRQNHILALSFPYKILLQYYYSSHAQVQETMSNL